MFSEDAIKTIFDADATLTAILTGGVYTYASTKQQGISTDTTPNAFDTYGALKPCVIIKTRTTVPNFALTDEAQQILSVTETVDLWLYDDSNSNGTALQSAMGRIYTLLHAKLINNNRIALYQGTLVNGRDEALQDALMVRIEFELNGVQS